MTFPQMPAPSLQWQIQPIADLPEAYRQIVQSAAGLSGQSAAQLLWQRGIRDPKQLVGFLNPDRYQPTSPFAFGQEMDWAIDRLRQARDRSERVAIWGDFDADGITATAVLWEGLGQFFADDRLLYTIPNRLKASHGLSIAGIDALAAQDCRLIVTCDNGSTNLKEIDYAQTLGIDLIITDHHTLPIERPSVVAIINPRALAIDHPLAHLSGVAVAYKLVEAFYETLPDLPTRPLAALLDLVAIGLIADLVQLTGDCRYLAQRGIERLQQQSNPQTMTRPGVARLLELCKRNGDRPTDISFGLGPRINAISRIYGDARFGVELLTSGDVERCRQLAEETELANTRRKSLQKDLAQQVTAQLAQMDLSTSSVIVLSNPQWSVGVLGLVAGQIAQQYGRPTILLSEDFLAEGNGEVTATDLPPLARGSARSVNQIDLYQLVQHQAHLLHSFGGHPFAAGLSLPIENLPLFTEAINRELREQDGIGGAVVQVDLQVTVAQLGQDLFRELKLLEPYGMGNPAPKLLVQNCWFTQVRNQNIKDWRGRKIRYIKTEFEICDGTGGGFAGVWWEHYKDDIPAQRCDAIVELDFNPYRKRYEVRLLDLRLTGEDSPVTALLPIDWIVDWRIEPGASEEILSVRHCPSSWDELQAWFRRAMQTRQKLAIAYPPPQIVPPTQVWEQLVGIAKYLSRTEKTATRLQLCEKLGVGDRTLQVGFNCLKQLGFQISASEQGFCLRWQAIPQGLRRNIETNDLSCAQPFLAAVQEEQFRKQYFYSVSLATIQAVAQQWGRDTRYRE